MIQSLPDVTPSQRAACAGACRPPAPTSALPATDSRTGGPAITITGWGLSAVTAVNFASSPATSLVIVNDTSLTCTTPAGATGAVNVVVTSPAGTGALSGGFTYS